MNSERIGRFALTMSIVVTALLFSVVSRVAAGEREASAVSLKAVPASGMGSDGACRLFYGDGRFVRPAKKSLKHEKQYFTTNPFGVFVIAGHGKEFQELGADYRDILTYPRLMNPLAPKLKALDQAMLLNHGDTVITLDPIKISDVFVWYLIKDDEKQEWYSNIARLVERYDGDSDYGGTINNGTDCYVKGDGLYPSKELRASIAAHPIKYWQIGNEPSVYLKSKEEKRHVTLEEFCSIYEAVYRIIKKADPSAKILAPANSLNDLRFLDGYLNQPYKVNWAVDCDYKPTNLESVTPNPSRLAKHWGYDFFTRFLLKEKDRYDIVDYHNYLDPVEERPYFVQWMKDFLLYQGITGKKIWSTENSAPFYFFPLMGVPKPTPGAAPNAAHARDFGQPYSDAVLAECLVKNMILQLAAGTEKITWFSLAVLKGELDNTQRLALIEVDGTIKPAYYTYKLLIGKLRGMKSLERVGDNIYKAEFMDRGPVCVAWSDSARTVDLSAWHRGGIKVTRIITEKNRTDKEVTVQTLPSKSIRIDRTPVFLE